MGFSCKRGQERLSKEDEHFSLLCIQEGFVLIPYYYLEIASMYKPQRPLIQLNILTQACVLLVWNFAGYEHSIIVETFMNRTFYFQEPNIKPRLRSKSQQSNSLCGSMQTNYPSLSITILLLFQRRHLHNPSTA